MADVSGVLGGGINFALSSVLGGRSQGLGNNINSFVSKVTTALSPTRLIGKTYASQNVLDVMASRGDPLTSFDWIAVVVNKGVGLDTTLPWYYINNIQMPGPSLQGQEKYVDGRMKKYAELFTLDQATIKIFSDTTGTAFNFANDWVRAAYRDDNLYQLPTRYKKDIYVFILDPTRKIVVDIQLKGCKPSGWQGYQLESGQSAALETSLTLDVDDFRVNYDSNPTAIMSKINSAIGSVTGGLISSAQSFATSQVGSAVGKVTSYLNNSSGVSELSV